MKKLFLFATCTSLLYANQSGWTADQWRQLFVLPGQFQHLVGTGTGTESLSPHQDLFKKHTAQEPVWTTVNNASFQTRNDSTRVYDSVDVVDDNVLNWYRKEPYSSHNGYGSKITQYSNSDSNEVWTITYDFPTTVGKTITWNRESFYNNDGRISYQMQCESFEWVDTGAVTFQDSIVHYYSDTLLDSIISYSYVREGDATRRVFPLHRYGYDSNGNCTYEEDFGIYSSTYNGDTTFSISREKEFYDYNLLNQCTLYVNKENDSLFYQWSDQGILQSSLFTDTIDVWNNQSQSTVYKEVIYEGSENYTSAGLLRTVTVDTLPGGNTEKVLIDSTVILHSSTGDILSATQHCWKAGWQFNYNEDDDEDVINSVNNDTLIFFRDSNPEVSSSVYAYNAAGLPETFGRNRVIWSSSNTPILSAVNSDSRAYLQQRPNGILLTLPGNHFQLRFSITDIRGRQLYSTAISASVRNWQWNNSSLASGLYLYRIEGLPHLITGKINLQ